MKRGSVLFGILSLLLLLGGCKREEEASADFYLYLLNSSQTALVAVGYEPTAEKLDERLLEIFSVLATSDVEHNYLSAIPADVRLLSLSLSEEGVLSCYFSQTYTAQQSWREVLTRAAVVRTLCQLEEVSAVEFFVQEEALKINDNPVGAMNANMFVTELASDEVQATVLTLYFTDEDKEQLIRTERIIANNDMYTMEQMVLTELFRGPADSGLTRTVPSETAVNRVVTRNSICYVDLNEAFLDYIDGMPDILTIYSIVNSLCELPHVTRVVFTVEGEIKPLYRSVDLTPMFEISLDLVKPDEE